MEPSAQSAVADAGIENYYLCGGLKLCIMSANIEKEISNMIYGVRPYVTFDYQGR